MQEAGVTCVNLRVIAKLKRGDRLHCADNRYFGIDRGWMGWLRRVLHYDSRSNTLDRLEATFESAKKESMATDFLIESAKKGVRELMGTYADDPTTVSRLETLVGLESNESEVAL
tara:strand:+ start:43010 stop:43354 length:345 start_codon:yes stop_codon:yes gene_type:complete